MQLIKSKKEWSNYLTFQKNRVNNAPIESNEPENFPFLVKTYISYKDGGIYKLDNSFVYLEDAEKLIKSCKNKSCKCK